MKRRINLQRARGFTLVELLVSVVISLIAVSGMILVMANMVGATNDTLSATRLSGELRTAMQVLTRDLRRANFDEDWGTCIGSTSGVCPEFDIGDTFQSGAQCLAYAYRRNTGPGTWEPAVGAVRLNAGVLQFNTTAGSCNSGTWVDITDGDVVQITGFDWNDDLGYVDQFNDVQQDVRKITITLKGQICANGPLNGCPTESLRAREITNTVYVRNAIFYLPS